MDPTKACSIRGRGEGRTALHWAARGGHDEVHPTVYGMPCVQFFFTGLFRASSFRFVSEAPYGVNATHS